MSAYQTLARYPSSSSPGKEHEVREGGDGVIYCTCPAWRMQKKQCKHLQDFTQKALRASRVQMPATPTPAPTTTARAPRAVTAPKATPATAQCPCGCPSIGSSTTNLCDHCLLGQPCPRATAQVKVAPNRNPPRRPLPEPPLPPSFRACSTVADVERVIAEGEKRAEAFRKARNDGAVKDIIHGLEWDLGELRHHPRFRGAKLPEKVRS